MSTLKISEEERKEILEKHKNATKEFRDKQASDKEGLKKLEKKEEPKKELPKV